MATRGWSWLALVLATAACSEDEPSRAARKAPGPNELPPLVEAECVLLPNGNVVAVSSSVDDSSLALFGIETREHQVFLHSTASGRRYTVKSKDGRVLAERIDETELGRDYPDLLEVLERGFDSSEGAELMGLGADD